MGVDCCSSGDEEKFEMRAVPPVQQLIRRQSLLVKNAPRYKVKLEEAEYSCTDEFYDKARSLDTW